MVDWCFYQLLDRPISKKKNRVRQIYLLLFTGMLIACSLQSVGAQDQKERGNPDPPPFQSLRAEEDYTYLHKNNDENPVSVLGDRIKYILIDDKGMFYARLGGQYRVRWEHFTNDNWTDQNDEYYSQRVGLHMSLHAGRQLRLFGEIYHGLTGNQDRLLQDDEIDLHQGFLEWMPLDEPIQSLSIRLGRQEVSLGVSRLIGIRDGPNMRRSFDLGRITYQRGRLSADLFFGQEVNPQFDAFDNESNLFDDANSTSPQVWAIYLQGPGFVSDGSLDVYYIGFDSQTSLFNDVTGKETRHSIGVRSSGKARGVFSYNTELIAQFGQLAGNSIRAFNFETDWKYTVTTGSIRPTFGIKLDWSTGDKEAGDGTIHTFNPLFVNPAIYSLAGVNTPANLTSYHPNITLYPSGSLVVYLEYALFYRTNKNDGFYAPPRFQTRQAGEIEDRHIGDVVGLRIAWQVNRNLSMTLMGSYFIAGAFIQASGPSNDIFYLSPTVDFKF